VQLADFTLDQIKLSVGRMGLPPDETDAIAARICSWVDGQPYLTQYLCDAVARRRVLPTPQGVDQAVARLRRSDPHHLAHILAHLGRESNESRTLLKRLLDGDELPFIPAHSPIQARLALTGIVKEGKDGLCVIRNRLYKQVLRTVLGIGLPPVQSLPQQLVDEVQRGNVALFVGAGLSMGAGLPGWADLIEPLAEQCGCEGDDLLKIAQAYEDAIGRVALITHLQRELSSVGVEPTANHALLTRLPIEVVVTTNFDNLLERAYHRVEPGSPGRRQTRTFVEDKDLPYTDATAVRLVKFHGCLDRPGTIVITEQDYHTIHTSKALLIRQLEMWLVTKTFLFVGYSVSDPDFRQVYDRLSDMLERNMRRPYMVAFGLDEPSTRDLERRGFHVICLPGEGADRNVSLEQWLRALVDAVTG
jgi:hypothetical protein